MATTGISLLTLVTLMACLTTRHAQNAPRDASITRTVSTILLSSASLVIVSSIEEPSSHPDAQPITPQTHNHTSHNHREHTFQFNPSLLAMPPPVC